MICQSIIDKYNVPVPRYTSYPPANYFHENFTGEMYRAAVIESNRQMPEALSFYFHVPYCRRLCYYCGCNAYPMASEEEIASYVDALHREIDLLLPHLDASRSISQIHYGGGTPTILPASVLKELNDHLLQYFPVIENPEIAIECHPGWLNENDWISLRQAGFNRFSLGIQDLNCDVLRVVNRKPSLIPVNEIVQLLHESGACVNMDFLYGLPLQTAEGFARTIEQAVALNPDRLVTFSYAHVPWVNKRQLVLEKAGLPDGKEKSAMFDMARQILCCSGYTQVGMDHFVKPDDELSMALASGQLHRNFQGYCTRRTTGQVYAFGVTGISQLTSAYAQNTKDVEEYIYQVGQGVLPVSKGYQLSRQEQVTRSVIDRLMCNYRINWSELAHDNGVSVAELWQILEYDEARMQELVADGLIELSSDGISVTDAGTLFVRNVAGVLDPLMKQNSRKFSKPI